MFLNEIRPISFLNRKFSESKKALEKARAKNKIISLHLHGVSREVKWEKRA